MPYEQVEHLSDDLAKYKSIWPAEYYVLHFGSAESVDSDRDAPRGSGFALDISRAASFARLVRHDSDNPNCALFPCRTHKSEGDSGDDRALAGSLDFVWWLFAHLLLASASLPTLRHLLSAAHTNHICRRTGGLACRYHASPFATGRMYCLERLTLLRYPHRLRL